MEVCLRYDNNGVFFYGSGTRPLGEVVRSLTLLFEHGKIPPANKGPRPHRLVA